MFAEILRLALPLIGAQLSIALMTFIDTLLMGQLGVEVLAGGGLGSVIYQFVYIVGIGVLVAVANVIAFAKGKEDSATIKRSMLSGSVLVLALSFVFILSLHFLENLLILSGQELSTASYAQSYLDVVCWSLIPAFGFVLVRSLLIGCADTKLILPISVLAAACNYPVSYVLMHGMFGLPVLGLQGVALGTCIIALFMFLGICFFTFRQGRYRGFKFWSGFQAFDRKNLASIVALGIPIALAHAMEIGLFSAAAFLIGLIGVVELAAHQVALQGTTLSFMIPLAISQAVSVKVGEFYGAKKLELVPEAVKAGMLLAFVPASLAALIFICFPDAIVGIFVDSATVTSDNLITLVSVASGIFIVAALFQLLDGWQVIFMGALRGFKLGTPPTVIAVCSYWLIGFPVSYWAMADYGAMGVWAGMGLGLAASAIGLAVMLRLHYRRLKHS